MSICVCVCVYECMCVCIARLRIMCVYEQVCVVVTGECVSAIARVMNISGVPSGYP